MASRIQGITVTIGGDTTGLNKALSSTNKQIRDTQGQLRDVERLLKLDPENVELLTQKQKLLTDAVGQTSDKLQALKEAEKQVQEQAARGDITQKQYQAFQREIIATEQSLDKYRQQLIETNQQQSKMVQGTEKLASGLQTVSDKFQPVTAGALGLVAAATAAAEGTKELRTDLSRLDQNAKENAVSVETARKAWKAFTIQSGETDSSVEAVSNLLQAGFTESNLQKAVEGLAGAAQRFPDTLKIESLADSLQETIQSGEATGQFGELLDRLGIGAENFSKQLAKCKTEAQKQNLALETLAKAGLNDTYNAWLENNEALVENEEATLNLQLQLAELAEKIQPIITKVVDAGGKLLDWFNNLDEDTQNTIVAIGGFVAAISPVAKVASTVSTGISKLAKKLIEVRTNMNMGAETTGAFGKIITYFAKHPVAAATTGIIALVGGLIAFAGQSRNVSDAVLEIEESTKKLNESVQANISTAKTAYDARLGEIALMQSMAEEVEALTEKENLNATEKERLATYVAVLNKEYPEMNLQLDKNGQLTKKSTQELQKYIENLSEAARIEAAREYLTEIAKEKLRIDTELSKKTQELVTKNRQLQDALAKMTDEQERYGEATPETIGKVEELGIEVKTLEGSVGDLSDESKKLQGQWEETMNQIDGETEETEENTTKSLDEIRSKVEGLFDNLHFNGSGLSESMKKALNNALAPIRSFNIMGIKPFANLKFLARGGTVANGGAAIVGEVGPELLTVSGGRATVTPLGPTYGNGASVGNTANVTVNVYGQYTARDGERIARDVNRRLGMAYR